MNKYFNLKSKQCFKLIRNTAIDESYVIKYLNTLLNIYN